MPRQPGVLCEVRKSDLEGLPARLWNRAEKAIRPTSEGKWSLYLDGSMRPKVPVDSLVSGWLKNHEIAFFRHPERDCAYEEIEACVRLHKILRGLGVDCHLKMKALGHPKKWGLWATGIVARRTKSSMLDEFQHAWLEMTMFATRDQIFLPHVINKLGIRKHVNTVDADIWRNKWFTFRRHHT